MHVGVVQDRCVTAREHNAALAGEYGASPARAINERMDAVKIRWRRGEFEGRRELPSHELQCSVNITRTYNLRIGDL